MNSNSDIIIETSCDVYEPSDDSFLLAENLIAQKGDFCLDVGCGSGILAVELAKRGCSVVAVDVNPKAVELTARNARLNGVGRQIEVRESDLFENVPEKFDFIVFNTPYLPVTDEGVLAKAWSGGEGFKVIHKFLSEVSGHLNKDGKFEILISSLTKLDVDKYGDKFVFERIASQKMFFEEIYILAGRMKN